MKIKFLLPVITGFLLFSLPGYAGPVLQHQPPTGLTHNTRGAEVRPDGQGGSTISKTTQTTQPGANAGTSTTTTVTQTRQSKKDGSTVDTTVTQTETRTTAKDTNGNEYVREKVSSNTTTTRTTNAKGETASVSTSAGHTIRYKAPNQDNVSEVESSTMTPPEKLETGPTGIVKKTYRDEEGHVVVETDIPGHIHSTKTIWGPGREHIVLRNPDGSYRVINVEGKTQTTEWYDKDNNLEQRLEKDKNGVKTRTYQRNGDDVTEVEGPDGKMRRKTVKEAGGTSYEIEYDRNGKPKKLTGYDQDGRKTREDVLGPEDQKDFEKQFGDDFGANSFGDGIGVPGIPGAGRDLLVGMDNPHEAAEPAHPEHHFEA